jgi:hypothetical protein
MKKNDEMIKAYIQALRDAKSIGNKFMNDYDEDDERECVYDAMEEIDNMNEHINIAINILVDAMKRNA